MENTIKLGTFGTWTVELDSEIASARVVGNYRLTPDTWGQSCVMLNEGLAAQCLAAQSGEPVESYDPDADQNDRPTPVVLIECAMTDGSVQWFAVDETPRHYARRVYEPLAHEQVKDGLATCSNKVFETELE